MKRRNLLVGFGATLWVPRLAIVADATPQPEWTAWTSAGRNPSGYTHDEALDALVRGSYMPKEAAVEFSLLANARGGDGRGFSLDPIEEDQSFDAMCFGGKLPGTQKQLVPRLVAKPSVWGNAPRDMRTFTWEGNINGVRVTVAYMVPLVCGNSSAKMYRAGAPVCVPIPHTKTI
jgi:hypothetical protein